MRISRLLLAPFLLAGATAAHAQTEEPGSIETDRPDQTETAALVPKGLFQAEFGFTYERFDDSISSLAYPNALLKYGLNENFELRLILEPTTVWFGDKSDSGFNPLALGLKVKLAEEKGIIPKTSLIAHMSLPETGSHLFETDFPAPDFRFTFQHTLSEKIKLGYNLGAEWDGFTGNPTYIYTLAPGFSLSEKWGAYVEVYGFVPASGQSDHRADGGFTYLLKNNMQLDLSGGFGLSKISPEYFVSAGYSVRLNK